MSLSVDANMQTASPPSTWPLFRYVVLAVALGAAGVWLGMMGGLSPGSHPLLEQPGMPAIETQAIARLVGFVFILVNTLGPVLTLWLGAVGLGWPLRLALAPDARCPGLAQAGAGLGALLLINYLLAWAGLVTTATAWGLPAVGVVLLVIQLGLRNREQPIEVASVPVPAWPTLLAAPAVGMMFAAAAAPPGSMWAIEANGYDVLSYHLQLPKEWLALGAMVGLEHNVYSYLPSLVEAQSMAIGAMRGSMYEGIYTTQFFQASCAIYAACALAATVGHRAPRTAAALAAVLLLVTPWTLILGSMAYNEMTTLALAAGAWLVLFDNRILSWRAAAIAGALLGLATLAKLTAGPNLLAPTAIITALGLHRRFATPHAAIDTTSTASPAPDTAEASPNRQSPIIKSQMRDAAVLAVVATLFITPYLIRNASWTGNPVFPFATSVFGSGHWTQDQVDRWKAAHSDPVDADAVVGLARQWLLNAGYGALGGRATTRSVENIAQFSREFGVPTLWLAVLLAAIVIYTRRGDPRLAPLRPLATAMLLVLGLQVLFWLFGTHHQSRFLAFTLLPGAIIAAIGSAWLLPRATAPPEAPPEGTDAEDAPRHATPPPDSSRSFAVAATVLALAMTAGGFSVMQNQGLSFQGERMPVWFSVDALPAPEQLPLLEPGQTIAGDHPMNHVASIREVWLVADASRMLYIRQPNRYSSAFDQNPLGDLIREVGDDPQTLITALRQRGVTHLWVHWSELARLNATYGYDREVNQALLEGLLDAGLREHPSTRDMPSISLLILPSGQR